jgi:hypothetical protein
MGRHLFHLSDKATNRELATLQPAQIGWEDSFRVHDHSGRTSREGTL